MKKLSLSVIAKNEELMIEKMLKSCEGVDEIIILDTGSTDRTIEIAEKYGTVLTHYKWDDNFSEARNECKKHCTGDWLLILDCDEVLDSHIAQIKNMINSTWTDKHDVLMFDVQTPVEKCEQPRLFRNNPDIWYRDAAHNLLMRFPDGLDNPKTSERIPDVRTFKTSYHITANVSPNHQADPDRTKRMLEKSLAKDPTNSRALYYYVREWLGRHEPIKALYWLDRYFRVAQATNECADAHFIAATCHFDLGDPVKAIDEAWIAMKILPSFRAPLEFLREIYNHPDMKAQLDRYAGNANNKGVLFVRKMERLDPKIKKK